MNQVISAILDKIKTYGLCVTLYVILLWTLGSTQMVPKDALLMGLVVFMGWYVVLLLWYGWRKYAEAKKTHTLPPAP